MFNNTGFLDGLNRALALSGFAPLSDAGAPSQYMRARWQSVKDSVMPLVNGDMPAHVLQAFDTESDSQKKYRATVYESRSQSLLAKAIDDVQKVVQSDDFVVSYNAEVADNLRGVRIGSVDIDADKIALQIMQSLYPLRVIDANGCYGYRFDGIEGGVRALSLQYYPSENILYLSKDAIVVALGSGGYSIDARYYRVYLRGSMFDYDVANQVIIESTRLDYVGDMLLCWQFGGRMSWAQQNSNNLRYVGNSTMARTLAAGSTSVVSFYESDFAFAVSQLNRLETLNSQNDIVNYQHAHPRMVGTQIDCPACDGAGKLPTLNEHGEQLYATEMRNGQAVQTPIMHSCKSCNGKGILPIGVQDYIEVPKNRSTFGGDTQPAQSLKDTVIAYVSPDTASAKHLSDQLLQAISECKEMLNLQRFEDFAESGAAKRIDQEAGQPRLRSIAYGIAQMIENVLIGAVLGKTTRDVILDSVSRVQSRIDSISVSIPSYFDMRSVAEAQDAYFANLEIKGIDTRYWEKLVLLKKRNATPNEIAAFKIGYQYTNGASLMTQGELLELVGIGALTEAEMLTALSIDAILRQIANDQFKQTGIVLNYADVMDFSRIFALITEKQAQREAQIESRKAAQMQPISEVIRDDERVSDDESDEDEETDDSEDE